MDNRRTVVEMNPTETELVLNSAESVQSYVVAPIIAGGGSGRCRRDRGKR